MYYIKKKFRYIPFRVFLVLLRSVAIIYAILIFSSTLYTKERHKKPVKVGGLFAITGAASFLGIPESNAAMMLIDQLNANGGMQGIRIELIIKDTASSPDKALSLASQLIKEDKVIAIIGPSTSGETMKIKNLCETEKIILISVAAAEVIVNPVSKYIFKTPQKDMHAVKKIYKTMNNMGISKIGIITSNDGFGNAGKEQLMQFASAYNIEIVISEVYDRKATDFNAILTKIKAQNVHAVINWAIVPAQSIAAKNMKEMSFNVPLYHSHGFASIKHLNKLRKEEEGIIFPAGRLLITDKLDDSNPQKLLLMKFNNDYKISYKEDASTFGGHAYDAVILLSEAIKRVNTTDKEKIRTVMENLTGIIGTGGIFNMSPEDHNGLDIDAFEILTVKDGKFVKY